MCGLAGFSNNIKTKDKNGLLEKMIDAMSHRGPDERGYYQDECVSLGSCRLSIIDIEGGHQPMTNEDSSIWVVYNGEIYNFQELREDLLKKGHFFNTRSDTEVIIHAYEEYGYGCLMKFKGMFAFALWDKNNRTLFLARDRLGIKPLYYTLLNNDLIFMSEIKALLKIEAVRREVDLEALDQYLTFLWVPDPKTIFKGIYKLPPGHYLVYKDKKLLLKEYWDLKFTEEKFTEEEWTERIINKFQETVKAHLISDVPLGLFLSGGVDSSAVLAFMSKNSDARTMAYTTAFRKNDLRQIRAEDDLQYARLAARVFNAEHTEIRLQPNIVDFLPKAVYYMDEPIADAAAITTYLICQAAKDKLKVLLSGMGGDEIFAGYPWDLGAKLLGIYKRIPRPLNDLISLALSAIFNTMDFPYATRIKKFINVANGGNGILGFRTYFTKTEKGKLYTDNLQRQLEYFNPYTKHIEYLKRVEDKDLLTQMLYLDIKTFLPCLNLAYTDKMSMANSIEARVPFLDHELVQLAASIPPAFKIKALQQKYIYKKALVNILPESIIRRKKAGFGAPVGAWLAELKPLIDDILSKETVEKRGYFNYDYVSRLKHREGTGWIDIWQLLTLELWHRIFIDGQEYA